jgi:hypothetical protein
MVFFGQQIIILLNIMDHDWLVLLVQNNAAPRLGHFSCNDTA